MINHPFIGKLDDQTVDDLQTKIAELNKKLNFAYRMGNQALTQQLRMALQNYNDAYQAKIREQYEKLNMGNKINISGSKDS